MAKLQVGRNDLATTHPEIAAQWHPFLNIDLEPTDVSAGSNRRAWWKCEQGHEWESIINNRSKGRGCPYCAGWLPIEGETDLQTMYPQVAAQWHPTKNVGLKDSYGRDISTPNKVPTGSSRKVWWQCEHGHEWESEIYHRTNGIGCPYCSGQYAIKGETDLLTTHPEIAAQWHPIRNKNLKDGNNRDISTPDKIKANSKQKVWWICEYGHEWQEIVGNRTHGSGCPYCIGDLPITGETDLATVNPEIAAQWHPTKNKGLKDKYGRDVSTPDKVAVNSNQKVYWECPVCKYEWSTSVSKKVRGEQCPCCANKVVVKGVNDLATTHPEVATQWHPTKNIGLKDKQGRDISTPDKVVAGSGQKLWWLCEYGHEWDAVIVNRTKGVGCPYCAGKRPILGETDFQTVYPDIAVEWHPTLNRDLKPADVTSRSGKKVWWQCRKGHEWEDSIEHRIRSYNCPYCSGHRVVQGKTDLQTIYPELAVQWHPTKNIGLHDKKGRDISTPDKVSISSGRKVWWQCEYGHEWDAVIANRAKGIGCPYCAGFLPVLGETDLQTLFPDIAKEWHPTKNGALKPTDVTAHSGQKVWWLCEYGHEWLTPISGRTGPFKSGCPHCSESKGEKEVRTVLEKLQIRFKKENTFKGRGRLRDDFAIFDIDGNVVGTIEYNGEGHYLPVDYGGKGEAHAQKQFEALQKRDEVKSNYLAKRNIPQLIIPFWEFDNIEWHVNEFIKELSLKYELFKLEAAPQWLDKRSIISILLNPIRPAVYSQMSFLTNEILEELSAEILI